MMILSFIAGALFILGHHLFYQSLHHKPTSNAVFQQQINTGIGTAFAFIVKMFLVISVGTGFWQIFWLQIRRRPVLIERVDVLTGVLEDSSGFLSVKTIGQFPILFLVAAITWLLPIAAIVPPVSLTIELSPIPVETVVQENLPVLNFNTGAYAQIVQSGSGAGTTKLFGGPQYIVDRLLSATAFSGDLLPFRAYEPNSSCSVGFHAPALQCRELEDDLRDQFTRSISTLLDCDITKAWPEGREGLRACYIQPMYMAWAPNSTHAVSFRGTNTTVKRTWEAETIGPDRDGTQVAQFYIASQPTIEGVGPWSFVGCELYNATYELNATFSNGVQNISVAKLEYAEKVLYESVFSIIGSESANETDPLEGIEAVVFNDLEHFAYYSIMDKLGRVLSGQITISSRTASGNFDFATSATSVMQTALVNTPELWPIFEIGQVCSGGAFYCAGTDITNQDLNITTPDFEMRLPQAVEQLFQNMTLSLFSDDTFRTFENSPLVDLIVRSPQNRYVYTSWRLLVPYLVGLAISAVGVGLGCWALLQNGASYTQSFSTVLRTSRYATIDVKMEKKDLKGVDPTPEYIQKGRIDFRILDVGDEVEEVELGERRKTNDLVNGPT
jgi:hypothetical protein